MKLQSEHENGTRKGLPENIEYLTSSCNRVAVLRALVEDSGKPAELRERLDIPRSTFRRILTELQERRWAEKKGGEYTATPLGEYVEGYFTDCVGTMDTLDALERFFEHVPFSEVEIGFERLVGAEVTVSGSYSPHAPMERYIEAMRGADEIKAVSPVITDAYAEAFHEAIINDGTYVENVIERTVADAILSRYGGMFEEVRDTGRTETYIHEGEFPFSLSILDDRVTLGGYDEDGIMRALVESEDPRVLEWAEERHAEYRRSADGIDAYLQTA